MARPRPWLAALLAFFYPGLGHVYLREWLRAILWFVLAAGTAAIVLPLEAVEDVSITDPGSITAASNELSAEASTLSIVVVLLVFAFSVADAYAIARGIGRSRRQAARQAATGAGATDSPDAGEPASCPACGRTLDEDLDFCHWCTTRLDTDQADDAPADDAQSDV